MKLINEYWNIIKDFAFTKEGVMLTWFMIFGCAVYLFVDWIIDEIKRRSSKKNNY